MTRPQMIRADTIDLQDQDSPSAKDHTRQPAHPAPYGDGPPAPHQERALKHAEQEAAVELHHTRSPRVSQDLSGKELQLLQEDGDGYVNPELISPHQDQHVNQRNGGAIGGAATEADGGDAEGDEGLEDDLMDKISSSPSIDEGGYSSPSSWPSRADSLQPARFLARTPSPIPHFDLSSSPFLSTPPHFPLLLVQKEQDLDDSLEVHHHQGGYHENEDGNQPIAADDSFSSEMRDQLGLLISEQQRDQVQDEWEGLEDSHSADFDPADFRHLLLPSDDPLLDNSVDDADLSTSSSESTSADSRASWTRNEHITDGDDSGGDSDDDDDDTEDVSFTNDPRYIDSGWGGECLRDTEDIDFEFVYALHTFVATVEGQANATKGDTMVLLDDSNSYWWLVRVVKDSSIADANRAYQLSQTMLSDAPEKSRNPLKKAIKRRNGKTVQFAAPTYVEASDVEYSTEEDEEDGDGEYLPNEEERPENQEPEPESRQDETTIVEPLKSGSREADNTIEPQGQVNPAATGDDQNNGIEKARTSDEMFESIGILSITSMYKIQLLIAEDHDTASKSRKGTLRNTDSLFKDDNTETRKINLTPSLLRDDSSSSTVRSVESKELKNRPSIDSLEKGSSSPEKSKDDRKRREKKGMLSGFFKRKDKKGRTLDESTEDADKVSEEAVRQSSQLGQSVDPSSVERQAPKITTQPQPQRQTSKLQKSPPPSKLSPKSSINRGESSNIRSVIMESEKTNVSQPSRSPPKLDVVFESTPLVEPEPRQPSEPAMAPAPVMSTNAPRDEPTEIESPKSTRHGMFSPIRDVLRSSPSSSEPKPEKAKKAKHRMPIDDFESSSETEEQAEPSHLPEERSTQPDHVEASKDRLSESPVEVSPQEQPQTQPSPALMIDTSSQDDPSTSPVSPLSSAELVEAPNEQNARDETPASTAQSSTNVPSWSDANLRAYLEDSGEIRDLLVVVHHKANVKPAPPDHPLVKNLFKEENRKLGEMSNRLDGLLGDWLARKSKVTSQ
ncbi:MAG: hypothetical protein Q9225_005506 [Loekoesia sp. 1 TL-2023]